MSDLGVLRHTVLQQVVFPKGRSPVDSADSGAAVLPLYVAGEARPERVVDRDGYRVPAGERVSLASYFNAFPAAYWQRWTDVEEVTLRLELVGDATVELFGSDGSGQARRVTERRVSGDAAAVEMTVPLAGFDAGGWLWCDVVAGHADVTLVSAGWWGGPVPDRPTPTASLGITTYNRVESCLGVLRQLGDDDGLLRMVDAVYVVDQGDDKISSAPGFAAATAGLGDRLTVLEQPNLGGSGGFARCQLETVRAGRSDHLVILDDDVVLETESIRRAVTFAGRCTVPTLVGAHMFSLLEPTRLHSMAECVDLERFRWGPMHESEREHDLAEAGLVETPWMHRREDVNYNGWWMCLIPRQVLDDIGLSLPFFIRWDDAEYGLRAGDAGYPTVSMPGVGVWHVPWTHKTDALDWQAYFHQRNRIISALLHSPHRHGGRLLPELLMHQVKHLSAMQYSTAELRLMAIADVLDGPEGLHAALATKAGVARRARTTFSDGDVRPDVADFPLAGDMRRGAGRRTPRWLEAGRGVARQLLPASEESRRTPQVHLEAADAHWSQLLKYDSAVVSTADGSGAVWYRRDRKMFVDIARRSLVMHRRLHREWPRLAAQYRDALAEIASPPAWESTFEAVRRGA
ncbi:MAG: glycosyltransferase [Nocardioidaceae bacterium]